MASRTASSSRPNHRASLALLAALCGVLVVPVAVLLSRPMGMVLSVGALLLARGARGRIRRTLERAGGAGRLRATRWLAVAGICVALSAAIAVGFYELLVRLEH